MPTYKEAGVDIEAGTRAVELIKPLAGATHGPQVLGGVGPFSGLFALDVARYRQPVLVASTDGVGTKVLLAEAHRRYLQLGLDLVNHCVNDVLTTGADPLFFLDYIATGRLDPGVVAEIVAGIADGCRKVGCALLGGETAEMPDVYAGTTFDLAGFLVGIADRDELINPSLIRDGDTILALPSSGLHTNGYSLARRVVPTQALPQPVTPGGPSVLDALLEPHRCYLAEVRRLRQTIPVKGLAHITGGGVVGNLPRILPEGLGADIIRGRWPEPPIFSFLAPFVPDDELWRAFNMGLGMLVVVDPADAPAALRVLGGEIFEVGAVRPGSGVIISE
jgi:phosphoribosylformylglycinamidine cyclo-ligase